MFHTLRRRGRQRGQTIILLALMLGILMIIAALVIDVGSTHTVRTKTQYVCDAGALAGIAQIVNTRDPALAKQQALYVCGLNGYVVGQKGVTNITARAFNHMAWPNEDPSKIDVPTSDRYEVIIRRELPQYIANIIGIGRTFTVQRAVAALIGAVPIDVTLGATIGFPDKANLSQFGPDAPYTFGDCYSPKRLDDGSPNPRYDPNDPGYKYDLYIPTDLKASTGSSFVRLEIFDPDTYNRGTPQVVQQPSHLSSSTGSTYEPDQGGLDEIRRPPPNGNGSISTAEFPTMSTQETWTVYDGHNQPFLTATYGPTTTTPFWYHTQDPQADPLNSPAGDAFARQLATDLHWVTPQGFEFDTEDPNHPGPYWIRAQTVSGSSENGYSMRLSAHRPHGAGYTEATYGVTKSDALTIYARGKIGINMIEPTVTKLPIGNVPSTAKSIVITNFDTDVGSQYSSYGVTSFDEKTGHGEYPVLFPVATYGANAGSGIVTDKNGVQYYTKLTGTLSANGTFATDSKDVPQAVAMPQTDGSGNLVFDGQGRITILDTRTFEGGDLTVTYSAGTADTSVWDVSFSGPPVVGQQQIVLIR